MESCDAGHQLVMADGMGLQDRRSREDVRSLLETRLNMGMRLRTGGLLGRESGSAGQSSGSGAGRLPGGAQAHISAVPQSQSWRLPGCVNSALDKADFAAQLVAHSAAADFWLG